jgi:glycosyltransferase involved in cell wall biosynthesis
VGEGGLRIWHIIETYPPGYGGGAAVTTRDICRLLATRGHEVRVLCAEAGEGAPYSLHVEDDHGVRVERVNLPHFVRSDPDGWTMGVMEWRAHERRVAVIIDELLDRWRPDLVDYHTARPFGEECLLAIARRRVPIVATMHEGWIVCPRLMWLRSPTAAACEGTSAGRCLECLYSYYDGTHARAALKLPWRLLKLGVFPAWRLWRRSMARRHVSAVFARSEFIARMARPHVAGEVRHIALGINLEGLPAARPVRPRTPFRFGFIGGVQTNKGMEHVLDASARLSSEGLAFEVHIWGPGVEDAADEIARRGLSDRVFCRGIYRSEERWRVFNEMDVAVMATTVCEPHGRVPYEARAVGAPTIAPAVGGLEESIRNGIDGLLFRFRDTEDLTRQMRRILAEPGLFQSLVANLGPVEDVSAGIAEIERFYLDVLDRKSGRSEA